MATFNMESTMPVMLELRVQARIKPILKKLKGQTHFSKLEIQALLIIYYKLTRQHPMDRSRFKEVMESIFEIHNEILMDRIFSAFDLTNSLIITPESWVKGLSIYLRGTLDEKIKFCFQVYDMFGDGLITKEMMFHTMRNCLILKSQDEADESLRELIDLVIKKIDEDQDGFISFEDYKSAVEKNNGYLEVLGQCLPSTPVVYKFMATFTSHVSSTKPPKDLY